MSKKRFEPNRNLQKTRKVQLAGLYLQKKRIQKISDRKWVSYVIEHSFFVKRVQIAGNWEPENGNERPNNENHGQTAQKQLDFQ